MTVDHQDADTGGGGAGSGDLAVPIPVPFTSPPTGTIPGTGLGCVT